MSEKTTTDKPVIEIAPEAEIEQTEAVVEPTRRQRAVNYFKSHKKATLAVVGLAGLVGVSAAVGRKTAPTYDFETLELAPAEDVIDVEAFEVVENDTVTA